MLFHCKTVPIRCDKYINWLMSQFIQRGGSGDRHTQVENNENCLASRAAILALTRKAFDFWVCNARVNRWDGSGHGTTSGMPLKCTGIQPKVDPYYQCGCTSYIQILGCTAIEDLLAYEEAIGKFYLRVWDCTGLLGVTMEYISSGEIGTRDSTGVQGTVVAEAKWGPQGQTWLNVVALLRYEGIN